jgi:hypothetical protein
MDGLMQRFGPLMLLLAPVVFAAMIGIPIGLSLWMVRRRERDRKRSVGFEVKRTTGETPVLIKERDDDHG